MKSVCWTDIQFHICCYKFTKTKIQNHLNCPSTDKCIKKISLIKEKDSIICDNMDEPEGHYISNISQVQEKEKQ